MLEINMHAFNEMNYQTLKDSDLTLDYGIEVLSLEWSSNNV